MGSDFQTALQVVLQNEGGYVNDPADPGGETYRGISAVHHPEWQGWELVREGLLAQVAPLVEDFYRDKYWIPAGCEKLRHHLAVAVFDAAVQHGVGKAVKLLQKALNLCGAIPRLVVDGVVGEKTVSAALIAQDEGANVEAIFLVVRACEYLRAISRKHSQARFAGGWANRVEGLM